MHLDTRLWMYRRGEARLFGHPGDVPHGEGWQRFPVVFDDDAAAADSPEAASPDVEPLETMSRRGLSPTRGRVRLEGQSRLDESAASAGARRGSA
jgi:hypothetical protein